MSLLSSLFGSKTTTKNTVDVDPKYQQFLDSSLDQAQTAFGQGYTPYTGERFSGFNADEMGGFDLARAYANPTGAAADMEAMALQRFSGAPTNADLSGFINPYAEGVVDRTTNKLTSNFDRAMANQRASTLGSFGGSRQGVIEAQMTDDFLENVGDIQYRGMADAYDKGIDRYFKTGADAFNMSGDAQARNLSRSNALLGVGGTQRALDQAGLDFQNQEFMRSINEPKADAIALNQIGASYPNIHDTTSTQTSTPSMFSAIGQVAGLAMGGLGMAGVGMPGASAMPSGMGAPGFSYSGGQLGYTTPGGTFGMNLGAPIGSGYYQQPTTGAEGGLVQKTPFGNDIRDPRKVQKFSGGGGVEQQAPGFKDGWLYQLFNPDAEQRQRADPFISTQRDYKAGSWENGWLAKLFGGGEDGYKTGGDFGKNKPITMGPYAWLPPHGVTTEDSLNPDKMSKSSGNEVRPNFMAQSQRDANPVMTEDIFGFNTPTEAPTKQEEQKNWLDRWVDNPLTELGLSLLASDEAGFGSMAKDMLTTRRGEKKENTRRDELAQEQYNTSERERVSNQMARDVELNNRRETAARLDLDKQRYAQEYASDMAQIAVAKDANKTANKVQFMAQISDQLTSLHRSRQDITEQIAKMDPRVSALTLGPQLEAIDQQIVNTRARFNENANIGEVRRTERQADGYLRNVK